MRGTSSKYFFVLYCVFHRSPTSARLRLWLTTRHIFFDLSVHFRLLCFTIKCSSQEILMAIFHCVDCSMCECTN